MKINEWAPGTFPIPFFQTWCCKNSSVTPSRPVTEDDSFGDIWHELADAGLPPKMYECIHNNLKLNCVGLDCIHYLFNDAECRAFIEREYPPDVLTAYDRLIPTAFKADLWRYCVLYKYGGVYLDVKYAWGGGSPPHDGCAMTGVTLRSIVERWLGGGGGCGGSRGDELLVLERDAVGLWPSGHFGIHNAFIITKPKNPLFLECIFRIVSFSKVGGLGDAGLSGHTGWITRPLFVTGPGLLGDVWRGRMSAAAVGAAVGAASAATPDSYATMAPYFKFFFEGNGVIGYYNGNDSYVKLFKVYEAYHHEYCDMTKSRPDYIPHYTVLCSQGMVWKK